MGWPDRLVLERPGVPSTWNAGVAAGSGSARMNAKLFTVDSATRLLPTVRILFRDSRKLQEEIRSRMLDWEFMQLDDEEGLPTDGKVLLKRHAVRTQIDRLVHKFNRRLELLDHLGAQVRDLDPGTIEFYAIREGRIVFLSWREGDETVEYWREYDGTTDARRHMSEL
jgi:hypothetical protein